MENTNYPAHGIEDAHASMVTTLAKPGIAIFLSLDEKKCHLWHMATGIGSEAGELLGAFKAHIAYEKPLDIENVIEELGDLEFFLRGLRDALGITRESTLKANMHKLSKRYQSGYSNEAGIARADKSPAEEAAMKYAEEHKNDPPLVDDDEWVNP